MSFSFLGYIHIEPISLTFVYIPVLMAGCMLGPKEAAAVGAVFGLASMWKASAFYVGGRRRGVFPHHEQKSAGKYSFERRYPHLVRIDFRRNVLLGQKAETSSALDLRGGRRGAG